ncbi:MAG: cytochrome c oxidase assembly protein subunit 15 [Saprospiraceae bacterium]|jgi:cytochrome c oxidase assembly protein subunit 15
MQNFFISHNAVGRTVKAWLVLGLIMIFFQVVIGGVTRLTGSGLSITKWEIVTGTLPPVNSVQWGEAFELYKGTPQYKQINEGMSMSEFKFIYFWEYAHRLWARTMGFVFLFPFLFFLFSKRFSKKLSRQLVIVFLLAALVASLGWIMVASGLIERPWVNAYKLTMHLSLAFILYGYLLWVIYGLYFQNTKVINNRMLRRWGIAISVVLAGQIILGGIMSGMKAGLSYPTWPDMNGVFIPGVLFDSAEWNVDNFVDYDKNGFMPTLIQVLHRSTAYLLIIIGLWYFFKGIKSKITPLLRRGLNLWITMLVIQITLGIITVLNCRGSIPVDWGVLHQAGALLLLTAMLFINFLTVKTDSQ